MRKTLVIIFSIIISNGLFSQRDFQILSGNISMSGKSTLDNWNATINKISGSAEMVLNNDELIDIISLNVRIDARSIKSDKGSLMDKNIYKSLKAIEHPEILFDFSKLYTINKKGKETVIKAAGILTIAGTSKNIYLEAQGKETHEGYRIHGSKIINLEAYNINPPSHFFGTFKADKLVRICFEATFSHSGICEQNVLINF